METFVYLPIKRAGGVPRGGRLCLREQYTQRLPWGGFFGTFLAETRKVPAGGILVTGYENGMKNHLSVIDT